MAAEHPAVRRKPFSRWLLLLICSLTALIARSQSTTPTFQITSAVYQASSTVTSASVPAGVLGAQLLLSGTLPTAAQQAASPLLACFYTGSGSTAGIPLSLPNTDGTAPLTVPASTIQSIPPSSFNAAVNYQVPATIYFIAAGSSCDGTFDATLTNQYTLPVVAAALVANLGPATIPQTNSVTSIQAAPTSITLTTTGLPPGARAAGATATISFGSFGSTQAAILSSGNLSVVVPPGFASSTVGNTATLGLCFTANPGSASVCTTPAAAITLTVAALVPSTGVLTVTPKPALVFGQTTLSAQFSKSPDASATLAPGAPSGPVTFIADGTTLPAVPLVLDRTATFVTKTTSITAQTAATPVISPTGGAFTRAQTITITDATAGASIFYTQDGSTPTTASTPYTAPFTISTSQTIQAIAAASGSLNSAPATAVFTITLPPPTQLAFAVQPVTTAINTAITPPIQVAVEDATGTVVTNATNAVTLALRANPGESALGGTRTVNAVNGIATFSDITLPNIATGYTLYASSGTLAAVESAAFNITPYPITVAVQSALIGIGSTLTGTFTLGHPAPSGGLTVTLSSSNTANVTIAPATVVVPAGQTVGNFTYTGVAAGTATLSASAPNYLTGTIDVGGTAAQVSLGTIPPVAPGQMVSLALSLPSPAPPGGTTVTFTSSNTAVATVTPSIFVPTGQRTGATNPQITGIIIGTTNILASAPGFAPDSRAVNVTVVGNFNPQTTNVNLVTSTNTTLNISAPAQTGGITFTLTSDDPTIASVASPVTIAKGATNVPISITGHKDGTTTIRADSAGVTEVNGTVNINSTINVPATTTGVRLESYFYLNLPVSPSTPTKITITSADPTVATLSLAQGTVGTASVSFNNVTSSGVGYVYVQGQKQGTVTVSISAPGYTTGTGIMTVDPSGFSYYPYYSSNFSTTTYSDPTGLTIYTTTIDPTSGNAYTYGQPLNPGLADINVPVTSSSNSVGTIVTSPVVFHAQDTQESFQFKPAGEGTANVTIGTPPAPFSVPTFEQTVVATVTKPAIQAFNTYTGVKLQSSQGLYLPVAPPTGSPVDVTITSANGGIVKIASGDGTAVGSTSVTFKGVTSNNIGTIYLQGISAGTTTLSIVANGYISGTDTITVYPSGFGYYYYYGNTFSTTTNDSPTGLTIYTETLDPTSLAPNTSGLPLSPGVASVNVPVTSSNTNVGTITASPLTFATGVGSQPTSFQPLAAGTTNITVGTPAGYTTPSSEVTDIATVTSPTRSITIGNDLTLGAKLQSSVGVYLSTAPTSPLTVTVTSANPAYATVANTAGVVGTASTTFTVPAGNTNVGTVYVQGQAQGATTLSATATGYTSGSDNVTVDPSGFSFDYYQSSQINTTTFSQPTGIVILSEVLDPNSLSVINYLNLNPNVGPINVPVISSAPAVGTISTSPVPVPAGNYYGSTTFQPVSAGTSNITLGTPAGFSTPSNYNTVNATVTAPQISVGSPETGLHLQTPLYISLPQTPPNAITVTITSNGPQIAILSTDGTVTGGSSVTFTNVTSTNVGYIYVQGESLGATTITVSAPGYVNGDGNVTVDPAGFSFYNYQGDITTSATSNPTGLTVYAESLTPGTLTVINTNLTVNPDFGTVNVPVTSSNTAVGTITVSPVPFAPGGNYYGQTAFQPVATGTTTITVGTPTGFSTPSQNTQITGTVQ